MPWDAATAWNLITANDAGDVQRLEGCLEMTQRETVDFMIEETCWKDRLGPFVGGKGEPSDRRAALIHAYRNPSNSKPFRRGSPFSVN